MNNRSLWVLASWLIVALAGLGSAACGSDKTGSSGSALSDCDAGDACAPPPHGGW
jgi:hypothetical protein